MFLYFIIWQKWASVIRHRTFDILISGFCSFDFQVFHDHEPKGEHLHKENNFVQHEAIK